MAATYSVDSLHINIAAGDSAIHLLIQTTGTKPDGSGNPVDPLKPWVVSAILIDGGDSSHGTPFNVQKLIQQLPGSYEFSSAATALFPAGRTVFDSVILTHWDKDHYRGLAKILNYDVVNTVTLAASANVSITADDIQISFFKYNGAGQTDPQTVFYCPNWLCLGSDTGDNKNYLRGHSNDFDQMTTGQVSYLSLKLQKGSKTGTIKTVTQAAKLDYTGLLGMEFFSRQKLSSSDVLLCTSPTLLVQKHNLKQGLPGAYCVATGGIYMHKTPGLPGVVNKHDSKTNASSISIMILWPPTQTGELSKMSHYFAGDAEFETEEGVVDWTGATTTSGYSVHNVKASHHGSATSFPTKMFTEWVPRNIIVSAGAANGHPRWELIVYLFAYKLSFASQGGQPMPEFYPTCYPYWFARNDVGKFILPKVSPADWDHLNTQYTQDFDRMWGSIKGNVYLNPRQQYVAQGFTTTDEKLQMIFGMSYLMWNYISQIRGEYYPIGSHTDKAVYFGTTSKVLSTRQKIKCIRLRSSYDDKDSFIRPVKDDDTVDTGSTGSSTTTPLNGWQNFPLLEWHVKLGPAASEGSIVIPGLEEFDDPVSDPEEGDSDMITPETVARRAVARRRAARSSLNKSAIIRDVPNIPTDGDFYCCKRTFVPGPHACALSGDLDTFLSAFHLGYIGVTAFPTAGGEAMVLANDEFNLWLAKNFGITQLGVTGDNTTISTMQCTLPFVSTDLTFATENVPWAFNFSGATLPVIPPTGPLGPVLYSDDMLILALGQLPAAVENIQLSDVCTFLGVEAPKFAGISLQLPLKLGDTTKPGYRNALWFMPTKQYQTLLRLALDVTVTDNLNDLIFSKVGLAVHGAQVILRKSGTFGNDSGNIALQSTSEIIFTTEILIAGEDPNTAIPFTATLIYSFGDGSTQIIVQCNADRTQWSRYLTWVEKKLNIPTGIMDLLPVEKSWFPLPRRVSLTLDSKISITALSINFEVEAAFGQNTAFLFTFNYTPNHKELSASLWPGPPATSLFSPPLTASMMPDYEDYQVFEPTDKSAQTTINLTDLLDSSTSLGTVIPNGILPTVTGLSLDLVLETLPSGKSQNTIEFYAMMKGSDSVTASVPKISLNSLGVDLKYAFGTSDFNLALNFSLALNSRSSANYVPVDFTGSVYYYNHGIGGSGSPCWQLEASVNGLMVGHLVSFFEPESQNGVMDLIEHIEIQEIGILYNYDPLGAGNHFQIDGTLLFGVMQLTLKFEHWPNDKWEFTADLVAPDETATINSVLGYISDEIQLPDFIGNIKLLSENSGLHLAVGKMDLTIDGTPVPYTFLQIDIKLGDFDVMFLQYTTAGWTGPKRIFRALVSGLSDDIPHIPVVDQLKQPYDELFFLYVQDSSGQPKSGILRQELDILKGDPNGAPITPPFLWKDTVRPDKVTPTDTIYAVGLHFDVVAIEKDGPIVVLDHLFSADPPTSSSELALVGDVPADSGSGSDASMGAMKKTFGPLTISNIGIQFKNKHLLIILDATFTLGPIALDLLGFGLDLDLSKAGVSLKDLPIPTPTISGLGFGFNQPPILIDGLFERVHTNDGSDLFLGGVVVAFEPYLFMAAGCYGIMVSGSDNYKTVALYALLEGPLVELEFAEIDGICGGFGYNSNVKFPTIDTITSFPFIAKTGLGPTPLDTINNLLNPTTGCINAQDGSIWLAAGLNVDAFKLLNVNAVVVIEFSAADVKLGIFADVIAVFPPDPESFKMIYAELGLMATVDFGAGTMLIQGQLAPTSYVLDPACHLSGGFALGYWFGSNQHAGDWVFTIGGYHPQFQAPSYYPSVPRLGITWSIDNSLCISGQAYFALTPNACMGGGQLKASLSLDPLYAYFEAFADFLIKFQPFYFIGDAGIDVGVRFTLDLWIVTIHINIDIGAELYIQGPPVHGYVHVDFWVFGFDIYFGDQQPAQTAVDLLGFWALLKQQSQAAQLLAGPGAANMLVPTSSLTDTPDPIDPTPGDDVRDKAHQIGCVGGQITSAAQSQQTPEAESWNVRAGPFAFAVTSPFVIGHVDIEQGASVDGSGQPIYSRPMELPGALSSIMTIKVTRTEEGQVFTDTGFRIQAPAFSRVPAAMWAQYSAAEDPLVTGNFNNPMTSKTDLASTTILHLMSVTAIAPKPYYPDPTTEPITKFNAVDASSEDVYTTPLPVASTGTASTNWEPVIPTPSSEWTDVPQLWGTPDWGVGAQKSTVDIWTTAMGAAWKNGLGADGALESSAPGDLLKGFEAYYMAAPLMTVAAAA